MRQVAVVVWLTLLWVVLWRDLSVVNVVTGAVVAVAAEIAQPWPIRVRRHRIRPLSLLKFVAYFSWELFDANIVLAREIVTPRDRIQTGVIGVPLPASSELVVTIVANAVSLTPGTLTLEVVQRDTPVLYVHVLHLHDVEQARADVVKLAQMANAAFPARSAHRPSPEGAT